MSDFSCECANCWKGSKIRRVLEAARALREEYRKLMPPSPLTYNLANAIDALDAPRERYVVDPIAYVQDHGPEVEQAVRDTLTGTRFTVHAIQGGAQKVADALNALNAAEPKPA